MMETRNEDERQLCKAVDSFAAEMKEKLIQKSREGHGDWDVEYNKEHFRAKLVSHAACVAKGEAQEIDTANLAMFLWSIREKKDWGDGTAEESPAPERLAELLAGVKTVLAQLGELADSLDHHRLVFRHIQEGLAKPAEKGDWELPLCPSCDKPLGGEGKEMRVIIIADGGVRFACTACAGKGLPGLNTKYPRSAWVESWLADP